MSYRNKKISKYDYYNSVKKTYEEHLINCLKEPFYKKIKDICDSLKSKNKSTGKLLKSFQQEMANVRKWDYDELKKASKFVVGKSKCNYVPKLIKAVIISNIKLLTATASKKKVEIEKTIPEPISFFHRCFIEISKVFYTEPFLICDLDQQPGLRLKNITESLYLIENCVKKTINSFLPYDNILDVYLVQCEEDSDSDDEPETPPSDTEDEESESEIDYETEEDNESEKDEEEEDEEEEKEEEEDNKSEKDEEEKEVVVEEIDENVKDIIQNGGNNEPTEIIMNDEEEDDLSISDNLPDELNILPMKEQVIEKKVEQNVEPKVEQKPETHEIKTVTVKKVTPDNIPSITKQEDVVFFDDADDI